MKITKRLTKNRKEIYANKNSKEFIIVHHTGSGNATWQQILRFFQRTDYLSVHYIIGRDGTTIQYVDDNDVAFHAGNSKWKSRTGFNYCSISIEIVSNGHDYTDAQRDACTELCKELMNKYDIKHDHVLRHADISGYRGKWDVGPNFYLEKWGSWPKFQSYLQNSPKQLYEDLKNEGIEWVKKNKISNGERPDDLISRADAFIMFMRNSRRK